MIISTVLIASAIAVNGAAMLVMFHRLVDRQAEIEKLHAVHAEIARWRSSIFWAEAAYRGFAMGGGEPYLEP